MRYDTQQHLSSLLKVIPENQFQECFQHWHHCLTKYMASQLEYFEADSSQSHSDKKTLLSRGHSRKQTVVLHIFKISYIVFLNCHTSYIYLHGKIYMYMEHVYSICVCASGSGYVYVSVRTCAYYKQHPFSVNLKEDTCEMMFLSREELSILLHTEQ